MTLISIAAPIGLVKTVEPHLLDDRGAVDAINVDLQRRSWRGLPAAQFAEWAADVAWVEPVSRTDGGIDWIGFSGPVALVESPVSFDGFDRLYWTDELTGGAWYARRTETPTNAKKLGVPAPTVAPTVTVVGGLGPVVDRTYVYVWRTSFGEQSAPSPPKLVRGNVDGTWTISGWTWPSWPDRAPVVALDIYRTVYSPNVSTLRWVASVSPPASSYVDTVSDNELAYREPITTLFANLPPADLRGLVRHPSGALAGWTGRSVVFSEPFVPHSWPPSYTYTFPFNIRAIAPVADGLLVFTTGQTFYLAGTHPSDMSIVSLDFVASDVRRPALAKARGGLAVATKDGLTVLSPAGFGSLSRQVYLPAQWAELWTPQASVAASDEGILVWFATSYGLWFQRMPDESLSATLVSLPSVDRVVSTGGSNKIWVTKRIAGQGTAIYEFTPHSGTRLNWVWRSKLFRLPKPTNLGVAQVSFRVISSAELYDEQFEEYRDWNARRFAEPWLDVLDLYPLGGEYITQALRDAINTYGSGMPPLQPLGGEPLWRVVDPGELAVSELTTLTLRVYADDRLVFEQQMQHDVVRRLPAGFRATDWQIELIGGGGVEAWWVGLGTTVEDLKKI